MYTPIAHGAGDRIGAALHLRAEKSEEAWALKEGLPHWLLSSPFRKRSKICCRQGTVFRNEGNPCSLPNLPNYFPMLKCLERKRCEMSPWP